MESLITPHARRAAPKEGRTLRPRRDLRPEVGHDRRWLTLAVLCVSLLVIVIDNTIVNVALPTLQRDLGTSITGLQWVVDAYTLVFAGLLLTFGALGDRFGRKGALTIGLVIFGVRLDRGRVLRRREPTRRRPCRDGSRCGADHAGDAVDHHQRLHRPARARASRSACGRASRAWPSRSVPSPVASCSNTSGGVRCSS